MIKFNAIIKKPEGINGAYIEVPFEVEELFGAKRVKVKVRFDSLEYRGSIVNMSGCYVIGMTQEIRNIINKNPGDIVSVVIEKDERTLILKEDFESELGNNHKSKENFDKLSFTNKKKYNTWIESAKKEETRILRIKKAVEMLNENKTL
jgi:acetyl-CoA carboxylase beta subunit